MHTPSLWIVMHLSMQQPKTCGLTKQLQTTIVLHYVQWGWVGRGPGRGTGLAATKDVLNSRIDIKLINILY